MVAGGVVYASSGQSLDAFAIDGCGAGTCRPLWSGNLGSPPQSHPNVIASSPVIAGDLVVATVNVNDEGWLYAFARQGCRRAQCPPLWRAQVGVKVVAGGASYGISLAAPVVAGGTIFVLPFDQGYLRAFSAAGCGGAAVCQPVWTGQMQYGSAGSPIVAGDRVMAVDGYGRAYAFPTGGCGSTTCRPLWTTELGLGAMADATPAVSGGRLFATTTNGVLSALDVGTGRPLWSATVPGQNLRSSPAVVGGSVVIGSAQGLRAYDAASGQLLWTGPVSGSAAWASATASSDLVYVLAGDSSVYAFEVRGCAGSACAPVWADKVDVVTNEGMEGPVIAEGRMLVGALGRQLICLG